jgi:hypothetical protein
VGRCVVFSEPSTKHRKLPQAPRSPLDSHHEPSTKHPHLSPEPCPLTPDCCLRSCVFLDPHPAPCRWIQVWRLGDIYALARPIRPRRSNGGGGAARADRAEFLGCGASLSNRISTDAGSVGLPTGRKCATSKTGVEPTGVGPACGSHRRWSRAKKNPVRLEPGCGACAARSRFAAPAGRSTAFVAAA